MPTSPRSPRTPPPTAASRRGGAERRSRARRGDEAQRILATVDSIPAGRVSTYGAVAREAGLPGRARLVGRLLSELPAQSSLAWHRVVNSRGSVSPRGGGEAEQRRRLRREGVVIDARGRVDLERFGWRPDG